MADIPPAAITAAEAAIREEYRSARAVEPTSLARAALEAAAPLLAGEPVTEHAQLMSGGGYHVRNSEPYIEEVYPLEQWIKAGQRFGGHVYRRRVIVVEDWEEVPVNDSAPAAPVKEDGGQ